MLMRSMEKKRSGEAGFTLVELLVVIAILAILATIVVFAVGGITDKGNNAANQTDCSVLQAAEEAYFAKFNVYTDSETDLVNAGFLHATSTKHPTVVTVPASGNNSANYTITGC